MPHDPFHEGEIAVQERAGERDIGRRRSAIFSPRIVPGALEFLAQQRLIALSVAGEDAHLWTSVWCGQSGFVASEDGERVTIRRSLMTIAPDDPVLGRLAVGRDTGLLAIELTTRRRLRINGRVERIAPDEIVVRVRESLANCPKYIQRRRPREAPAPRPSRPGASATSRSIPAPASRSSISIAPVSCPSPGAPGSGSPASCPAIPLAAPDDIGSSWCANG
jgi:predicted pyridoxine 5'-phosphate oxidase superfamily flavin-nucleotide-binding protein